MKTGAKASRTTICSGDRAAEGDEVDAASGTPRTSDGQKCLPYSRTLSATSWPTVRVSGGSGGGSGALRFTAPPLPLQSRQDLGEGASASSRRHRARSGSSISFEITRASTAGTPASSAARRTAKPSIASTSTPLVPPTRALVPIGRTSASGNSARSRSSSDGSGRTRAGTSGPAASQYTASEPRTRSSGASPRAPAMPTCRRRRAAAPRARGRSRRPPRRGRCRRRRTAPRRPAVSSRSVAAITRTPPAK